MERRNTLLITVIAIATLLVAVVGATFAYFASTINTNNGNVNLNLETSDNKAVFTSSATGGIDIKVESYMMQQHDAVEGDDENMSNDDDINALLTNNANLNVTLLASEDDHETQCTYDLIFKWDNESGSNFTDVETKEQPEGSSETKFYKSKYYVRTDTSNSDAFKELTIEVNVNAGVEDQKEERPDESELISERNLDTFNVNDSGKMTLISGETITSVSKSKKSYSNYNIIFRFYNLKNDQSKLMDKKFKGTISVDNIVC